MNNRSLSRGDAVVIGAAVLLFIFSFLDVYTVDYGEFGGGSDGVNAWESELFPILPSVFLSGIIGAGLIIASRFLPQPDREFLGLRLNQWGIALSVTALWAVLWTMIGGPSGADTGVGLILGLLATLLLAAAAALTPILPPLQVPLTTTSGGANKGVNPPYGQQPGGYGYPSGQQPGAPAAYQPTQMAPAAPAAGSTGTDPNFQPFWFAVPAARPLYGEDGSPTPVAELAPGTWYLAVEQRGQALVAQTQDGRRGVLQDTSGIQRG
ncbi:DUF5336 domain-containing protein [Streptomyces sp. DSM 44917]|uniref:DUF5336 domain-containing protein n=1 Tax=Streptomyces boetiae TaxID=3075541 RepID=A0ABU2L3I8_9ACTN|nr:DUF5336 domain-containing protein [Streptomyces sp. DSM 44917]MDT0306090.1 DUF5336 domain-containing protein [Streptomyces sp. DSM 44917]